MCRKSGLEITVLPDDSPHVFLQQTKPLSGIQTETLKGNIEALNAETGWKFVLLSTDVEFAIDKNKMKAIVKRLEKVEQWIEAEDTRALEASEY
jgi:hypothetical protein